jgi:transposase
VTDWEAALPLAGLRIDRISIEDDHMEFEAHRTEISVKCPYCGQRSSSVHSHYYRHLGDLPISHFSVRLVVQIRRFRCRNGQCSHRTFAEPLGEVAPAFARRTRRVTTALQQLGLMVGATVSSRITGLLQIETSADTLLRIIRQTVLLTAPTPKVLGIDDWALRRGKVYGTILVDLERQRPIDLLTDRTAETLATWLRAHPGVQMISRDRSTEYARGASDGAPQAQQVADRWHLLKNLREALERMLNRLRPQLGNLPIPPMSTLVEMNSQHAAFDSTKPSRRASKQASRARRYERYQAVRRLAAQGIPEVHIAQQLGLARATVRQFARTDVFPERAVNRPKTSLLDPYLPYLHQRLRQGCTVATQLWQEIQAQGYPGSRDQVARWLQAHRTVPAPTTPGPYLPTLATATAPTARPSSDQLPAPRQLVWLLLRPTDDLTQEEQSTFARVRQHAQVDLAYRLARRFQTMVRLHTADDLQSWFQACLTSDIPDLQTFVASLIHEEPSIRLALSMPWSTGPVEGHVNRLKLIKRSMYGRAKFDLLRLRVLAAPP